MAVGKQNVGLKASWILFLATVFWGFSFLAMKAIGKIQVKILPEASTWFLASLSLVVRFGFSTLILMAWSPCSLRVVNRRELEQGVLLGLVGGLGLLVQMDAVNYTSASTTAFLTQCYCLFIPVFLAFRKRRWPATSLLLNCAMVVAGVAILSQFNWREMRFGRGEWEAMIASLFFTAQILWLEEPKFAGNHASNVTVVMFAVNLVSVLPVFLWTKPSWAEVATVCNSVPVWLLYAILTIFCTLGAYTLMNHWQPHIDATRAGLIYCAEPVFTSIFALFIPHLFSVAAGIDYPNEKLSTSLLIGGGLITAANILNLLKEAGSPPKRVVV
ncbi:MAG: DMT family transporter [Verrucomicrobiota bacterium]